MALSFDPCSSELQPLANLPPIANAGPDQTIEGESCLVEVELDGSASTDANFVEPSRGMRWFIDDAYAGAGQTLATAINTSGLHLVRLEVLDAFGSRAQDEMVLNLTLPPECAP